jgi:hypothetical protein
VKGRIDSVSSADIRAMTAAAEHFAAPMSVYSIEIIRSDYAIANYYVRGSDALLSIGLWRKHGHWVTGEPERVFVWGRNIVSYFAEGLTSRCS